MDQSTHDVRRTGWLNIITECQQRPAGVSAKQWLADNGVKEKAYYYWLRKLRREDSGQIQLPAVTAPLEVSFAEFSVPASNTVNPAASGNAVAVIRTNGATLEVSDGISEPLLKVLQSENTERKDLRCKYISYQAATGRWKKLQFHTHHTGSAQTRILDGGG